jgi:ATP-dependent DNA helicase RecG
LPQRNRRIGEFLKDLRLAEMRNTGIPKIFRRMQENGSPRPIFDFDEDRTYFRVILPAHPRYVTIHALREAAQLWATGERQKAIARLEDTLRGNPSSGVIVSQLIDYHAALGDFVKAKSLVDQLDKQPLADGGHLAYIALARAHLDRRETSEALRLLEKLPPPDTADEALEMAILLKRSGRFKDAHKLFVEYYGALEHDPKAVHEFAQTKIKLASQLKSRKDQELQAKRRLNEEAKNLLRRVIQLADHPVRAAWAWSDLAKCLSFVDAPGSEVLEAYQKAIELAPEEPRFKEWKRRWEERESGRIGGPEQGR